MKQLSSIEFVILSLVAERPVHGYQVEQMIENRGMRSWTDIGFSSIYHVLRKLQLTGILTSQSEFSGVRPTRNVFSLTAKGGDLLHKEVLDRLSTPRPHSVDFDLALSCLPILSEAEIISGLNDYVTALSAQINEVQQKQQIKAKQLEAHVKTLFDHSLQAMNSELAWVSSFAVQMKNQMENDPKDLLKLYYSPSAKEPQILDISPMNFLMIDGHGDPYNNPVYQSAVSALYTLSFTLKFELKKASGTPEYKVFPLQGLWWAKDMNSFIAGEKSAWDWTMMIAQPAWITKEHIDLARKKAAAKVPELTLQQVRFETYAERTVVQLLHIGHYNAEGPNIARLHEYAHKLGYERCGKHHEIYISDPRRTVPEKLKTIIRQPIRKTGA